MKSNKIKTTDTTNLIGENTFKQFLEIQATYGFAQRGGSKLSFFIENHAKRLVTDVNLLVSKELKKLVFNEIIFGN